MLAEMGYHLTRCVGVCQASRSFAAQPANDGNAAVAKDHQRVVRVTHHSSQLRLQNLIQQRDDGFLVNLLFRHSAANSNSGIGNSKWLGTSGSGVICICWQSPAMVASSR